MFLPLSALFVLHTPPKPAWIARVGSYSIVKWPQHEGKEEIETLYLKDKRGRVVASLRDYHVGLNDEYWDKPKIVSKDYNHDGVPDVLLQTWSGGAHGSNTYHLWSLGKRPRCLLAYDKNNVSDQHDFEFVDLDGDGIPEIRSWYDGFAYTVGASNWQDLPIVFHYEKGRYVERTSRYPKLLRQAERNVWKDLAKGDGEKTPGSRGWLSSSTVNLIALGDVQGTLAQTWRRLKKRLPKPFYRWAGEHKSDVLEIMRIRSQRYAYPAPYRRSPVKFDHRWVNAPARDRLSP